MAEERLQKILARAGVASRRAAEQLITRGEVRVNGKVVSELGARAELGRDRIEVRGAPITREQHVYYLLHKPRAMVTTLHDPEGRPSLGELLQGIEQRVYPVGRLDFHTSGALLLTNDGDLAQALLHPSREVPKTYIVKLNFEADDRMLQALRDGVTLDDGYQTAPARVSELRVEEGKSWLEITISEGKNRQIHRMLEAVGARVMRLSRQSFAGISSEGLRPGQLRPLERYEVSQLLRSYLPARAEVELPPKPSSQSRPRKAVEAAPPSRPRSKQTPRSQGKKAHAAFDRPGRVGHKKGPT
jgi:23S rRNA pseudouridine2605 synthase